MSAPSLHNEDCQLKEQGRLSLSHERGTGLGTGHLAENMTLTLGALQVMRTPEVLRGTS